MLCRLNVTNDSIRMSGLNKRWPKRVSRYLAPLDFVQQSDKQLTELLSLFDGMPRPISFGSALRIQARPMIGDSVI
jgi:hypothetical protein